MKTQIAAIEFGTSKIVTMIAQNSGMDRLDIIGSGTVPYDGYSQGDWNTPGQMIQRVRDSIAAAELEANKKITEIYVGVPGEYIHVRSCEAEVDLPDGVVDQMAKDAVQDAAAEILNVRAMGGLVMHRTPSWFIVDDGKKTMSPSGKGTTLKALTTFILADPQFLDDVREMLGRLNIKILGFLAPTLGESLLLLSVEDRANSRDEAIKVLTDISTAFRDLCLLKKSSDAPLRFYTDRAAATELSDSYPLRRLLTFSEEVASAIESLEKNMNVRLTLISLLSRTGMMN